MKANCKIFAAILLLTFPSVVLANAGTPLMWAGIFHLLFGNLIIGLGEGLLLAKIFKCSKLKCVSSLILANYLSAWLGGFVIARGLADTLPMGLKTAWPLFWGMVVFTYLLTLLIEFPFVAWEMRRDPNWLRNAIRGSLLIQTVSYLCLFGWYWSASGTSLYTETRVVELSEIPLPDEVFVYYISADDGDVYAGSLQDAKWEKVFDLDAPRRNDRLFVRPSTSPGGGWDLIARLEGDKPRSPVFVPIEENIADIAAPAPRSTNTESPQYDGSWFNFGEVPQLGQALESSWRFRSGFWPIEGLRGNELHSGERVSFSLETPFVAWSVRNATHLPGDKVLLQLGDDQICVYDPFGRQIALLARGRGPVAVMGGNARIRATENHPVEQTD